MSYILDSKLQTKTIFLSTIKALSRNPFLFQFNNLIRVPSNMQMVLSVEDFVIPNSFFNINTFNNNIIFQRSSYPPIQVDITPGLYNINQFVTEVNLLLISDGIIAVYNAQIFKLTFVAVFAFSLISSTLPQMIGVGKDDKNNYIYPIEAGNPAYTITMPGTIDFSGTPYIFLKTNDLVTSNLNSFGIVNNTIARIPINAPPGFKIFYRPTDSVKYILSNSTINSLTFYLEDYQNNLLNIGPTEFEILLKISFIYTPKEVTNAFTNSLTVHLSNIDQQEEEVDETPLLE